VKKRKKSKNQTNPILRWTGHWNENIKGKKQKEEAFLGTNEKGSSDNTSHQVGAGATWKVGTDDGTEKGHKERPTERHQASRADPVKVPKPAKEKGRSERGKRDFNSKRSQEFPDRCWWTDASA